MYPFLFISLSFCLLTSCTVGDWSGKVSQQNIDSSLISTNTSSVLVTETVTQEILTLAYQEELLAHDIYTKMVTRYPNLSEIVDIIRSEAEHQDSVGRLLDARGIARPTDYGSYQAMYDMLAKMIDTSLTGAIEVGIMVETGDIDHLLEEYRKVTDTDIRRTFENIGGASFNHLRAFLRLAKANNYTPITPASKYLTDTEVQTSGPLKYKMTELLEANGLPTYGGSRGDMNHGSGRHGGGMGRGNGSGMGDMGQMGR